MLSEEDRAWLAAAYPDLTEANGKLSGTIQIVAAYDEKTGLFQDLRGASSGADKGIRLEGNFQIQVVPREVTPFSRLPALMVEGADWSVDRHFNQNDKTACLCSPLEEQEFLEPSLQFRQYMGELVVPFLYGQLFYSAHRRWPWPEYSHGPVGLLESYSNRSDSGKAMDCVEKLRNYSVEWPIIKRLLAGQTIKGHVPCLCRKKDHFRRCHPKALQGIRLLLIDLQNKAY
jgi:hypothetical protein